MKFPTGDLWNHSMEGMELLFQGGITPWMVGGIIPPRVLGRHGGSMESFHRGSMEDR